MDDYHIIRAISEGTFGRVYQAQHRVSHQTVAIKLVSLTGTDDNSSGERESDTGTSSRELEALQLCRHANVNRLHTHFVHQHALALVLDYMHCDLAQLLHCCQRTATPLPLPVIRLIAHQLLTAIAHIHSLGVLHRDIKPSNILLPAATTQPPTHTLTHTLHTVQLADFGQSCTNATNGRPLSPAVSTRWYKAPELLLPSDGSGGPMYGSAVDVWAAGCVLAECVSGAVLLAGNSDVEQLTRIAAMCGRQGGEQGWEVVEAGKGVRRALAEAEDGEGEWQDGSGDEQGMRWDMLDLLDGMVQWDPVKRMTAEQALHHSLFTRTAVSSESTDMGALLRWFDQAEAEQNKPNVPTSVLLQQPLAVHDMLSPVLTYPSEHHVQHRASDTTCT